ncbi:MAG: NB-ARC domain-containing protein [Planctomycetota bacterium]
MGRLPRRHRRGPRTTHLWDHGRKPQLGRATDSPGHTINKDASLRSPALPPNFIRRDELLNEVVELILAESAQTIAITGKQTVGVYGMGGIGKTVLATSVASDERVKERFTDGVHWITVGDSPNIASLQSSIAAKFGKQTSFPDGETGNAELRELLNDKNTLLILDDVWKRDHATLLDVVGAHGRILITTRDARILTGVGASKEVRVEELSDDQAIALLEEWSGQSIQDSPDALAVVEQCGRLPLAVSVCGAMARDGDSWSDLLQALKDVDTEFLDDTEAFERGVFQSLALSIDRLSETERERYLELAVFPSDETIPTSAVCTLWAPSCNERIARRLLRTLDRASLLRLTEEGITFHDLQHDFLRAKKRDSLPQLHGTLLDAYRDRCNGDWTQLEDDGYIEDHLCYHLGEAGKSDERKQLLLDYRWLQRRADSGIRFCCCQRIKRRRSKARRGHDSS